MIEDLAQHLEDSDDLQLKLDLSIDTVLDNEAILLGGTEDTSFEVRITINHGDVVRVETRASQGDEDHETDREFDVTNSNLFAEIEGFITDSFDTAEDYFVENS